MSEPGTNVPQDNSNMTEHNLNMGQTNPNMVQDNPNSDRFHVYTFGERDMQWSQWLGRDEPSDSDDSDETVLSDAFPSSPPEIKQELEEGDRAMDVAASDASSSDDNDGDGDGDGNSDGDTPMDHNNNTNNTITTTDMATLKRLCLLTYPGARFVQLPQFKHWLSRLTRAQALALLDEIWTLDTVIASRLMTVTNVTVQHPDPAIKGMLERACTNLLDEEVSHAFDIRSVLRAKPVAMLRRYVSDAFAGLQAGDIIERIVPGGLEDRAFVAELYGSAVIFGCGEGEGEGGFGVDCQQWMERMGGDLAEPEV